MKSVELQRLSKNFGTTKAVEDVSIRIESGEVLAVVGENGAGKSTLMSLAYGAHRPDSGTIRIDDRSIDLRSPAEAIKYGIGMVYQHFELFPDLTVAENLVFGAEPARLGFMDRAAAEEATVALSRQYGLDVPATARVRDLPVGVLQRVEILKSLYRKAQLLILDEPTGVLTPQEARGLFTVLRDLATDGRMIIVVTHKLDEVMAAADRVVVLRDGRAVFSSRVAETNPGEIARHMTGRPVDLRPRRTARSLGDPTLQVCDLSARERSRGALGPVSFTVREREICGIAGVAGNGQELLAAVLAGHLKAGAGQVILGGREITVASNTVRRQLGLAHITEDRNVDGVCADGDLVLNLLAGAQRDTQMRRYGLLRRGKLRERAAELVRRFRIKTPDLTSPVAALSGGNVQKVVVARELSRPSRFLIAEQPTRGVDLGAVEFIWDQLEGYRADGGAVLLISSELNELLSLCDRILVMYSGRVVGEFTDDADPYAIGRLMAGDISAETVA